MPQHRSCRPTDVRAPRALWAEPTGEVLGRDFYVMERLPGAVYEREVPPELDAVDQHGQVIDVLVSARRDSASARRFFARARQAHGAPDEVTTDKAPALALAIEATIPHARHDTEQYANNRIESDHARLKARLRPMRGLKRDRTAAVIIAGRSFCAGPRNLSRGLRHERASCSV